MSNLLELFKDRIRDAVEAAFEIPDEEIDPSVTPATDPRYGHYQCNAAMGLARKLKEKPRDIAGKIIENLKVEDLCLPPEMAGPGFINLTLSPEFLTRQMRSLLSDGRLGILPADPVHRVLVEFSSPNIAKELHVGHLRSTIIGDCLAKVYEFLGHEVLRRNHVGDWGTQFGMLIAHLEDVCPEALNEKNSVHLGDIVEFYKQAKKRFDEEEAFKSQSRKAVIHLQSGEEQAVRAWKILCRESRLQYESIYRQLDVSIEEKGESFYHPFIPDTLDELKRLNLAVESGGALCVFPKGFSGIEGEPLPLIVQKSDGGYGYDTTDMAAIRYRVREEKVDKIIYITDAGQASHFAMVFQAAREAGWLEHVEVVHVPFGLVQGEDRKKLKTRSGETVRLQDLLNEAVERARKIVDEKNPDMDESRRDEIARVIGLGAVKYADLSQNRISDYIFSFDKMLSLQGNTAPYLIYAYVRVQSIARKGTLDYSHLDPEAIQTMETPEELELSTMLLRLPEALGMVEQDLLPNRLTDYLFNLSQTFSRFYTNNQVLDDPRETTRLALCDLSARTLKLGLSLLGIKVIEEM